MLYSSCIFILQRKLIQSSDKLNLKNAKSELLTVNSEFNIDKADLVYCFQSIKSSDFFSFYQSFLKYCSTTFSCFSRCVMKSTGSLSVLIYSIRWFIFHIMCISIW